MVSKHANPMKLHCDKTLLCCIFILGSLLGVGICQSLDNEAPRYFVYVSDKRIITAELTGSNKIILNYINLSDVIELIEAQGLLVIDEAGNGLRGHLFLSEETTPSGNRYEVNDLVKPTQFRGFDILGNFRWKSRPSQVILQLGSRLVELESIDSSEFDVFATKVAQLDLSQESGIAVSEAGFWQGQGFLYHANTEKALEIESRYPRRDPSPPVPLESPQARLPDEFSQLPDPVVVQLRVQITSQGGVQNPTVARSIDPELDQLAIQVVLNSWQFLPAVAKGKPVGSETVLNVQFLR